MELAVAGRRSCARRCSGFVDVTPACRSLDDLARHLTAYLDEVRRAPAAARRRACGWRSTKAGRAALGAAAAAGVRHMAHRFIVGETPRAALRLAAPPVGARRRRLGRPARRGDRHRSAEADRYAARCLEALETLAGGDAGLARAAGARARLARAGPAREPVGQGLGADAAAAPGGARASGREDAARRMRPLLRAAQASSARTCTSTWSRSTRSRRRSSSSSTCSPRPSSRDGPVGRASSSRPTCASRPSSSSGCSTWARAHRARAAAGRAPRQGRLLGPRGGRGAPARLDAAGVRATRPSATATSRQLTRRLLDARPLVRVAIASHNLRSVAHAIAYNRAAGRRRRRPRAPGAARARRRPRGGARRPAAARAHLLPGRRPGRRAWPTSSGGCSRTPRNESFLREQAARRRRSRSCWRRREPFRNEPILELRRAAGARGAAGGAARPRRRAAAARCRC